MRFSPSHTALGLTLLALGCSEILTSAPSDSDLFDAPLPGLTPEQMAAFDRGDEQFGRAFAPAEGLGPIFNNTACAACHSGDGRGRPENNLVRFGVSPDLARHLGGPQLQTQAISGAVPETLPAGVPASIRLPPPVFGMGLVEAIPEETILSNADPDDQDGDGISGRPNWVVPPPWVPSTERGAAPGPRVGRFSRKAQVSTLIQQTVEAYHQDMGITSDFLPAENANPQGAPDTQSADHAPDPEVSEADVRAVVDYIRMLAPPAPGPETAEVQQGRTLFAVVGCASCHIPVLRSGAHPVQALSTVDVSLFSDLLLHDMGDDLADGRPDGQADGREWRTSPLWGLRLVREFLDGDAFFLHDGRARSIEEAIMFHGGEGAASRSAFNALSASEQAALLGFVGTR